MKKKVRGKKINKIYLIFIRYLILFSLIFSIPLIYKIFTPLTVYPVFWLLNLVYEQILVNQNIITISQISSIELVPACIAGSAYLLLLILNLSVPMKLKQRIYSILFSFGVLLILNILRIFILSIMYHSGNAFFDITHKLFWYWLSTFFVVGIWFLIVKIFKIKQVPVYSDIKYLMEEIKRQK
jgi:exosortase/archaeosortase family protein